MSIELRRSAPQRAKRSGRRQPASPRQPFAAFRLPRCIARWGALLLVVLATPVYADVERRTLNDGNLVLEDIPQIPAEVVNDLNRYQNIRAASFRAFTPDSKSKQL